MASPTLTPVFGQPVNLECNLPAERDLAVASCAVSNGTEGKNTCVIIS